MKKVVYFILVSLLVFTSCKKDGSNPVDTNTIPLPPTLASPTDTTSNIAVPVVLTWNESSGAKSYTLQVSASSSFSSFVFNKSDITTTTQQVPDLNYLAVYYWRVSATNSAGTSDWSKVWSFTTTKDEPALVPQLSSPTNGAVDQKFAPVLTWNKVNNANRYAVQLSTNSSFTSFVFDEDSLTTTSKQIVDLSGTTKYYWRVSATNNFGTKGWSETWSFITGVAPVPPVLLSPSDGAVNQLGSPTFIWNTSTGATSYTLQVSTDNSFANVVYNNSVGNVLSKQISGLSGSTKYYWRASTTNSYGTSNPSDVWSFTTGAPPNPPILLTPTDGAPDILLSPTLIWNPSSGATSYTLQVSTNSSFASFVFNQSIATTNKQLTGLTNFTKYYWRVSTTNSYGASNPSDVWSFTTGALPLIPSLSSPQNGAIDVSLSPTLTWNASTGATNYSLQVSLNNSFTSLVFNQSELTNITEHVSGLNGLTKYYWRVKALNSFGNSIWSDSWFFETQTACGETATIIYDNKAYHTVSIGKQCWLKENLDIGTMIQGTTEQSNNSMIEKYCYDNNLVNCSTYGGFYQWDEAMTYSTTSRTKGICPSGWHIPTGEEFVTLKVGVNYDGNALKAVGQGIGNGAGTNTSGFSALLAGYRYYDGNLTSLGANTTFWSSSASYMVLVEDGSGIYLYNGNKVLGYSIRCLKD